MLNVSTDSFHLGIILLQNQPGLVQSFRLKCYHSMVELSGHGRHYAIIYELINMLPGEEAPMSDITSREHNYLYWPEHRLVSQGSYSYFHHDCSTDTNKRIKGLQIQAFQV